MKQAHKYLLIAQKGSLKQPRFEKAVEKAIKLLKKLQPKVEITPQLKSENDQDIEMKSQTNDTSTSTTTTTAESKVSENKNDEKAKITKAKPTIRESWYQSDTNISFILYAKNMTEKDVSIQYATQSVVIEVKL